MTDFANLVNDRIMLKPNLAVNKKKTCFKTNPAKANCNLKGKHITHVEEFGLSINGERVELLPVFAEATSNRITKKCDTLSDERAIVLKFYLEERESGAICKKKGAIWRRKGAEKILTGSITTPGKSTNEVPSEAFVHGSTPEEETEQKGPNQSVFNAFRKSGKHLWF